MTSAGYIQFVGPNPNIKNFAGFEAITSLSGGIILGEGMVMTDFTGLDNVTAMFYLDIWCKLDSFKGLGSLESTLGWIDIYPTADVPNFKGLNSFVFADRIGSTSPNLTSLEGPVLPQNALDTSHLQSGTYLLSVGEEVFKVMVQQ